MVFLRGSGDFERVNRVVDQLEVPPAVFKTAPWYPRPLVTMGLRQWLRCAGAALREDQVIGMPSHAVDEAWHGFILCTERYATFCQAAYGQFLHHHPEGGATAGRAKSAGPPAVQLRRTLVAWTMVARPDEPGLLWDLDDKLGVDHPWGIPAAQVTAVLAEIEDHARADRRGHPRRTQRRRS